MFVVLVLGGVQVGGPELLHEVEGLVEVVLSEHLVADKVEVVSVLDLPLRQIAETVDARLAGVFDSPKEN